MKTSTRRAALQIGRVPVQVHLPVTGEVLEFQPQIRHTVEKTYYEFADIQAFDTSAIEHVITLAVTKDDLALLNQQNEADAAWAQLARFTTSATEDEFSRGSLEIARLLLEEFPTPVKYELGESWF